jgi:putative ABC transport system permease protein
MWAPLALAADRAQDREARTLTVVGKLRSDEALTAARAEMQSIGQHLEQLHPGTNRDRGVAVEPLSTAFRERGTGPVVAIIQAAGALVLLVACANIAGLLLARGLDRTSEFAVRTALGASRMRILRQLVTESVLLALLASVAAILLAGVALDVLRLSIPADMARFIEGWDNIRLNRRLAFAVPVLALIVSVIVGLIPALAATRSSLADTLKGSAPAGAVRHQRGRQALLVAQVACALTLLIVAGLTVAGGIRLIEQPGGFAAEGLLRMEISLPAERYREPAARREFARNLLERIHPLPMVERAALASVLPAGGWSPSASVQLADHPEPDPARRPRVGYRSVTPEYFDTMRIAITCCDHQRLDGRAVLAGTEPAR